MIAKNNKEIRITLTQAQANWLENICKKANITKSRYISWILAKKAEEMLKVLNQNTTLYAYTEEEISEILKTPWIDEK